MSSLKIEFATVRELEKKSSRLFIYGGGAFLLGVILIFIIPPIGIILTVLSALAVLGAIAYISMLARETSKPMFCPYCSSKNDVYMSRQSFDCDICGRLVKVSENGEPMMSEEIDLEARYDRKPSL